MKRLLMTVIVLIALSSGPFTASPSGADQSGSSPTVDEIVQDYIDAIGGREAIESFSTRVCLGRIVHDLSWKRPPREVIPFASYAAGKGKVLMVEHKSDGTRCEGSDGENTWVQDAAGITLKGEPFRSKTAWLIDPQGALRLEAYFGPLGPVSTRDAGGRLVNVVESSELAPDHYALSFDAETGLLVGIGHFWALEDYREVDGVKIPHRVAMSRKGGSTTFVFDLVEHNLPLEEMLFAPPAYGEQPGTPQLPEDSG